jgi:dihydrolipoamide dehydrogenase
VDVVEGRVDLEQLARTETFGTGYRGEMRVLVDRGSGELVGAWAVGPCASEWIGAAVVAVKARMTLATLRDMPMQFPTFGEALGYAIDDVDL